MTRTPAEPPAPEPTHVDVGGRDETDIMGALHDVSNALTVLLGWLAEARADDAPRETVDYALDVVERRARMARDLARRAIGAAPPEGGEEELDAVLTDAIAALRVEAARAKVSLERAGTSGGARVRGGSDVSHALTNLLLNSLAHAPKGSKIEVTTSASDTVVSIDVQDQGPGVSPARRASIFEGDSRRAGGAGVGLRHARAVAREVGGDLELTAGWEGAGGARFRLTWPRSDLRVPPPPPSIARVRALEGKRILVVEDDADVIELLETALGARGAEVAIARTAPELNRLLDVTGPLREMPHDAALLDLSPIVDDVPGALAALAAHSPRATIVLITGSVGGLPPSMSPETVRWVRKPFEVGEVVAALAAANGNRDDDA